MNNENNNAHQATVLLGVTGCIAAYKACELVRALQKEGYRVKVCMTPHATEFVGPTTFRALTHEPVAVDLFSAPADPIYHVSLAQEADVCIVAPCTANVLAKLSCGIADDLLTTTLLATTAPLIVAPAMNVNMYEAAATQHNMEVLRSRGVSVIEAESGYLACGDVGKGRLPEISVLVDAVKNALGDSLSLQGKKVLITAGPTQEYIDPVRYISNHSSGKMGYALAECAAARGAEVHLVSGPVALPCPRGVKRIGVTSAHEMLEACKEVFNQADIAIFSAAVSDFRPQTQYDTKLKKASNAEALQQIVLEENPDILSYCGHTKKPSQIVVGFAAETNNLIQNAQTKLNTKAADLIVANDVSGGKVFGSDSNQAFLVSPNGVVELPSMSKRELAGKILDACTEIAQK